MVWIYAILRDTKNLCKEFDIPRFNETPKVVDTLGIYAILELSNTEKTEFKYLNTESIFF